MRLLLTLTLFVLSVSAQSLMAQSDIWLTLSAENFEMYLRYDRELDARVYRPDFGKPITDLEGEVVTVEGFLVPVEIPKGAEPYYVLSAVPYQACFFCGGAGPETVMEVFPEGPYRKFYEDKATFRGTLRLNRYDTGRLYYRLENAERIYEAGRF